MLLNDTQITTLLQAGMIKPYILTSENINEEGRRMPSRGLSSFGYDISLGNTFKTLRNADHMPGTGHFIDPANMNPAYFRTTTIADDGVFVIGPGVCVLAVTREQFDLPRDILAVCMQKSTIARSFLDVMVTPAEPEWQGYLTLELYNKTTFPIHLRPGMGIAQMLFFQGEPCATSYADRGGKYQGQGAEPVIAR